MNQKSAVTSHKSAEDGKLTASPTEVETGGFAFREGTCDANVYRSVVELNEYRLPDKFEPNDIVLDVGCHIGSFAKACADRGAGEVVSFEPEPGNVAMALANLAEFIKTGSVFVLPVGIWRSEQDAWILRHSGYSSEHGAGSTEEVNTGGGDLLATDKGAAVVAVGLDFVLAEICDRKSVRLLKLDCEYAEWPILLTSKLLHYQVEAICGEFHELTDTSKIPEHAVVPLVGANTSYTESLLRAFLESRNYKVETRRQPNCDHLGLFWAWRAGFEFSQPEAPNPKLQAPGKLQ
jgi:FkbM family methyltransferase